MLNVLLSAGGDDDGATHHGPFGLLPELDPYISTLAFIGVILFTILFEFMREKLDETLADSPYGEMVKHIYQELTVLGLISFGVFLLIYAAGLDQHARYFEAFEFAHIIIFFLAIFFILQSALIITASKGKKKQYDTAVITSIDHLVEKLKAHQGTRRFRWSHYFPLSSVREAVEFKILHIFFVRCYKLPRDFVYGDYLGESLNEFIKKVINIDISSWLCMIVLLALNIVRIDHTGGSDCSINYDGSRSGRYRFLATDDHTTDDHTTDDHGDHNPCYDEVNVNLMLFSGFCIFLLSLLLLFLIRRSERKLLKKAGLEGPDDFQNFLVDAYLSDFATVASSGRKKSLFLMKAPTIYSLNELKDVVIERRSLTHGKHEKKPGALKKEGSAILDLPNLRERRYRDSLNVKKENIDFKSEIEQEIKELENDDIGKHVQKKEGPQNQKGKAKIYASESQQESVKLMKERRIKFKMNLKDIYIFHSPFLFYKSLDVLLLLSCLYWALCSTNYFILALDDRYGLLKAIGLGALGIMTFPVYLRTVMIASRLQSLSEMNVEALGKVVEETEERRGLKKEFINAVREKLTEFGVGRTGLVHLFDQIDKDSSGEINLKEFRAGLALLNLRYSRDKLVKIFHLVDQSGDKQISLVEFSKFIFAKEARRQTYEGLKRMRGEEVRRHSLKALEENSDSESDASSVAEEYDINNPGSDSNKEDEMNEVDEEKGEATSKQEKQEV